VLPTLAAKAPPTLRDLELRGFVMLNEIDALAPRLPALRKLGLWTTFETAKVRTIGTLIASPFPHLHTLTIGSFEGSGALGVLRPLLQRADLPHLTDLTLAINFDEALCTTLAEAPLGRQLTCLGLPGLVESSADLLLANLARFPRLARIAIPIIDISNDTVAALRARVAVDDSNDRYEGSGE
jgi:hypothetical protein